jgi:hypothetical protein
MQNTIVIALTEYLRTFDHDRLKILRSTTFYLT